MFQHPIILMLKTSEYFITPSKPNCLDIYGARYVMHASLYGVFTFNVARAGVPAMPMADIIMVRDRTSAKNIIYLNFILPLTIYKVGLKILPQLRTKNFTLASLSFVE
jgi:hypothetical protein